MKSIDLNADVCCTYDNLDVQLLLQADQVQVEVVHAGQGTGTVVPESDGFVVGRVHYVDCQLQALLCHDLRTIFGHFRHDQEVVASQWAVVDQEQNWKSVKFFDQQHLVLVDFVEIEFLLVEARRDRFEFLGLAPFLRPIFVELKLPSPDYITRKILQNFINSLGHRI